MPALVEMPPAIKIGGLESEPCATATYRIHAHEDVAVTKERAPQPGRAINLRAMPCEGNSEPSQRAIEGAKNRGSRTAAARARLLEIWVDKYVYPV
jgi:hypothetical protein